MATTSNYNNLVINRQHQNTQVGTTSSHYSRPPTPQSQSSSPQKKNKSVWLWSIPVVLFLATSALSYFLLFKPTKYVASDTSNAETETADSDSSLLDLKGEPKDQACPLNGRLYTATERQAWEKRRPMAVMVENTPDARPQAGLSSADIVYEAVAEGGITRFMPIFYCGVQAEDTTIAPIRSARTYFINLASGYNRPLYVHVGGANLPGPTNALGQLGDYGWEGENDINQFSVGYPTFVRNYNRIPGREIATEHTMETTSEGVWKVAEKRGWTNMSPELMVGKKTIPSANWKDGFTGWKFVDGQSGSGSATDIKYSFWSGYTTYDVQWKYDATTNTYKRFQNGGAEPQLDINNNQQLTAHNVVIMFAKEEGPLNENKHMMYEVIGTGKALIFKDGSVFETTWNKKDRESELNFTDDKGKDFEFNRGQVWISVVDKANKPTY